MKSAVELSDQELRHVVWAMLRRLQVLEVHLAEAVSVVLFHSGGDNPPTEAEYSGLIERLTGYLEQTNRQLQRTRVVTDVMLEREYEQN